jgi:hypothetical protein
MMRDGFLLITYTNVILLMCIVNVRLWKCTYNNFNFNFNLLFNVRRYWFTTLVLYSAAH